MTRSRFIRSLGLLALAPAIIPRVLAEPPIVKTGTIWFAQTEDGELHGGRMVRDQGRLTFDRPLPRRVIGVAYYNPSTATAANGWTGPKAKVRCYGSLAIRRS